MEIVTVNKVHLPLLLHFSFCGDNHSKQSTSSSSSAFLFLWRQSQLTKYIYLFFCISLFVETVTVDKVHLPLLLHFSFCGGGTPILGGNGVCHTPSIAFRHLPPNSARFSYATERIVFISAQWSTEVVSALLKGSGTIMTAEAT